MEHNQILILETPFPIPFSWSGGSVWPAPLCSGHVSGIYHIVTEVCKGRPFFATEYIVVMADPPPATSLEARAYSVPLLAAPNMLLYNYMKVRI